MAGTKIPSRTHVYYHLSGDSNSELFSNVYSLFISIFLQTFYNIYNFYNYYFFPVNKTKLPPCAVTVRIFLLPETYPSRRSTTAMNTLGFYTLKCDTTLRSSSAILASAWLDDAISSIEARCSSVAADVLLTNGLQCRSNRAETLTFQHGSFYNGISQPD
jgi:hypothetical protein